MKRAFFISAIMLGSFIIRAQQVELGLKSGLNAATVHGSTSSYNYSYDPRVSMYVGGLAHIRLTREFAIQPEVVFSGQGYKTGDNVYRLNYLNVPVLLQYMFGSGFRLETGPQVGVLLTGKLKNGNPGDIKKYYKDLDFAWTVGAGYLLPCGLGFDARFNAGIPKINDLNDDNLPDRTNRRNAVFQAGIFYQFRAMKHQ